MTKKLRDLIAQADGIQAAIDRARKEIVDLKARVAIAGLTSAEENDMHYRLDQLENQFADE